MNHAGEKWSTLSTVRAALLKKWERGYFLKRIWEWDMLFPLRVALKGPTARELSKHFAAAQEWVGLFPDDNKERMFIVEWRSINHRLLGKNRLPGAVVFESISHMAGFVGKKKEYERYCMASDLLLTAFPKLGKWVESNPFKLLAAAPVLKKLITVSKWMEKKRRPGIYLRQISLPGIDTKFIELHKRILSEWLDILLPISGISFKYSGISGFEKRYGYAGRPASVRFRILDKKLFIQGFSDLTVKTDEFRDLNPEVESVFVTENDINGLSFPMMERSIIIFGRGYGFDCLAEANWLLQKKIWYWGDIDTHGFSILSQFRSIFPHTVSLLMDKDTFLAHKEQWGTEQAPFFAELSHLTPAEQALYDDLRFNRWGNSIRLEQEFILWELVEQALKRIGESPN